MRTRSVKSTACPADTPTVGTCSASRPTVPRVSVTSAIRATRACTCAIPGSGAAAAAGPAAAPARAIVVTLAAKSAVTRWNGVRRMTRPPEAVPAPPRHRHGARARSRSRCADRRADGVAAQPFWTSSSGPSPTGSRNASEGLLRGSHYPLRTGPTGALVKARFLQRSDQVVDDGGRQPVLKADAQSRACDMTPARPRPRPVPGRTLAINSRRALSLRSVPICRAPTSAPVPQDSRYPTGQPLSMESSRSRPFAAPETKGRRMSGSATPGCCPRQARNPSRPP